MYDNLFGNHRRCCDERYTLGHFSDLSVTPEIHRNWHITFLNMYQGKEKATKNKKTITLKHIHVEIRKSIAEKLEEKTRMQTGEQMDGTNGRAELEKEMPPGKLSGLRRSPSVRQVHSVKSGDGN